MRPSLSSPVFENKTETHAQAPAGCGFIVDDRTLSGRDPRRCGGPVFPGSAYCATHHSLCAVSPASAEGGRALRRIEGEAASSAPPPREFAYLAAIAVPELESDDEPRDLAGCLDLASERPDEEE